MTADIEILDFANYPEDESREELLLALARADGQPWESMAEASRHTAEVMYGDQADAVEALLVKWADAYRIQGAVQALKSAARDDNWRSDRDPWEGDDVRAWLIADAHMVASRTIVRTETTL